jgi:hypothetical protein
MENIDNILDRVLNSNEKFELYENNDGKYLMFPDNYWYKGKSIYIVNWTADIHGLNERGLTKQKAKELLSTLSFNRIVAYQ